MAYDRDPSTKIVDYRVPIQTWPLVGHRSYEESKYVLCQITLDILHRRVSSLGPEAWVNALSEFGGRLDQILVGCREHLNDIGKCRSVQDRVEHLALRLHLAFVGSRLRRRVFVLQGL